MKRVFILSMALFGTVYAAHNSPQIIKNSEEIVSLKISLLDQPVLKLCQQYPIELNFMDEKGTRTALLDIMVERELDPVIGLIQRFEDKNSMILTTALSNKTYQKMVKSKEDMTDTIRIVKSNKETLMIKVHLIDCSPKDRKIKVVNILSQPPKFDGQEYFPFVQEIKKIEHSSVVVVPQEEIITNDEGKAEIAQLAKEMAKEEEEKITLIGKVTLTTPIVVTDDLEPLVKEKNIDPRSVIKIVNDKTYAVTSKLREEMETEKLQISIAADIALQKEIDKKHEEISETKRIAAMAKADAELVKEQEKIVADLAAQDEINKKHEEISEVKRMAAMAKADAKLVKEQEKIVADLAAQDEIDKKKDEIAEIRRLAAVAKSGMELIKEEAKRNALLAKIETDILRETNKITEAKRMAAITKDESDKKKERLVQAEIAETVKLKIVKEKKISMKEKKEKLVVETRVVPVIIQEVQKIKNDEILAEVKTVHVQIENVAKDIENAKNIVADVGLDINKESPVFQMVKTAPTIKMEERARVLAEEDAERIARNQRRTQDILEKIKQRSSVVQNN